MSAVTNLVLYDDQCPMCAFQMRVLTWLDWFHTVSLLPMSHPRALAAAPGLTREALQAAVHAVTPDGRVYRGARCLRFVGMRMPLLAPLALLLWIPGMLWVAERVYAWVSRNRYVLSALFKCKEACALLPERKSVGQEALRSVGAKEGHS